MKDIDNKQQLKRWRLILGAAAEGKINSMGGGSPLSADRKSVV